MTSAIGIMTVDEFSELCFRQSDHMQTAVSDAPFWTRDQLAEIWALSDQLQMAVSDAVFVTPEAANALTSRAKQLTTSIVSFETSGTAGARLSFPQLLAAGGELHHALKTVQVPDGLHMDNDRRRADCDAVIEKLVRFQVSYVPLYPLIM